MTHWGWYWKVKKRHTPKAVCDYKKFIDSFEIMKIPCFMGFTVKSSGGRGLKAALVNGKLKLSVEDFEYFVPIEQQACHFGYHPH